MRERLLIEPAHLQRDLLGPQPPVVLDIRWSLTGPPGRDAYEAGHIPGAAFVDLNEDLADAPGAHGRHPLPRPDVFIAAMQRVGVNTDSDVVVYDQGNALAAARAWWLLRHYGHAAVRVLDGGWQAWIAAAGDTSTAEPSVIPGNFSGTPGTMTVVDAVGAAETASRGVLIDARAAERYRGEVEPVDPVAGHIPSAINIPTDTNVAKDATFLPAELLREQFRAVGIGKDASIAAYCGSGVTACHEILALRLAGFDAALYPESWSGWIKDPSRPVATG